MTIRSFRCLFVSGALRERQVLGTSRIAMLSAVMNGALLSEHGVAWNVARSDKKTEISVRVAV
jgi:hypothetical protein